MSKVDKLLVEKFMRIAKIDHLKESFDKRMVKEGDGFDFPRHQSSEGDTKDSSDLEREIRNLAEQTYKYVSGRMDKWNLSESFSQAIATLWSLKKRHADSNQRWPQPDPKSGDAKSEREYVQQEKAMNGLFEMYIKAIDQKKQQWIGKHGDELVPEIKNIIAKISLSNPGYRHNESKNMLKSKRIIKEDDGPDLPKHKFEPPAQTPNERDRGWQGGTEAEAFLDSTIVHLAQATVDFCHSPGPTEFGGRSVRERDMEKWFVRVVEDMHSNLKKEKMPEEEELQENAAMDGLFEMYKQMALRNQDKIIKMAHEDWSNYTVGSTVHRAVKQMIVTVMKANPGFKRVKKTPEETVATFESKKKVKKIRDL